MVQAGKSIVVASGRMPAEPEADYYEAGFGRLRSLLPVPSKPERLPPLLRALAYNLRRNPGNLRAHFQHLSLLCQSRAGAGRILAAAEALFQILGQRGAALRQRVENLVAPHLSPDQMAQLRQAVEPRDEPAPPPALVIPFDHAAAARSNPVAYADELLCLGDYEEAMAVLERALAATPADAAIAAPLQAIYRSARDRDAYERSRTVALAVPANDALWPPAEVFFGA